MICVLSFLVVAFGRFLINVSTMNIGNVSRLKGIGMCEYCKDERGLCDRHFLVDDRCFSIKLDETFEVDTVSHNNKSFFVIKHDSASFASTYNFNFLLFY